VNSVLKLRVPRNAGKLSSGLTSNGYSNSAQLHRVSYVAVNDERILYPYSLLSW
jgi:hypothetical protein